VQMRSSDRGVVFSWGHLVVVPCCSAAPPIGFAAPAWGRFVARKIAGAKPQKGQKVKIRICIGGCLPDLAFPPRTAGSQANPTTQF
jgi:hypothetical protein